MLAPQDLIDRLDAELRLAAAHVAKLPDEDAAQRVAAAAAEPELGRRVVLGAVLSTGQFNTRAFDYSRPEVQDAIIAYEDAVASAVAAAVELLAYEEVDVFVVQHAKSAEVVELVSRNRARDRMRGSILGRIAEERRKP